ncbi:hypothetical protein Taro_039807, partial [Colocasia esculenta]|nr:hypothetical protein [Colocasia esculenta]
MQGLVQAMQTQAHTQAALQAQLEAQVDQQEKLKKKLRKDHEKHKKFKRKAMTAAWDNEEASSTNASSLESENEQVSLALMVGLDE